MTSSDSDTDSSETASDNLIIGDGIREHVQLEALPEDLLAAIVAFADLKTLGAGVAVCRALRSASERLSPRLEYSLLVERFNYVGGYPLLSVAAPPIGTVSPRDFFRTYDTLGALFTERSTGLRPTVAHDAYTLTVELGVERTVDGQRQQLSIHTGTLGLGWSGLGDWGPRELYWQGPDDGMRTMEIPPGVYERAAEHESAGWNIYAKVVAWRRIVGRSQLALLYYGRPNERGFDPQGRKFPWLDIPSIESNPAVAWALQHGFGTSFNLGRRGHLDEQIELPWFFVFWNFPLGDGWDQERDAYQGYPSTVNANFYMGHDRRENRELSLSEACVVFERLVAWSD